MSPGGIHAVIGPNGAGKTTLFNLVCGLVPPTAGRIVLAGQDVTRMPADRRAGLGLGRTFQNIRIFGGMTVLENVLTGCTPVSAPACRHVLRLPGFRARSAGPSPTPTPRSISWACRPRPACARRPVLRRPAPAGDRPRHGGLNPACCCWTSPPPGMNPAETEALATLVRSLRGQTTVLLVEHDMGFVMDISDRVTVLNFGRLIFEGAPSAVRQEPAVIEAYLGHKVAARLAAGAKAGVRGA